MDVRLRDEEGRDVTLREVVTRPTALCFVYFRCPGICTPLLTEVADLLSELEMKAGEDFDLVTVSFDPSDTPAMAREKRKAYLGLVKRPMPESSWRFLTGEPAEISRITDAAGFRYTPDGKDYQHPKALIFISPEGKIVRYLTGKKFVPFDFKMAVAEANEGRAGFTVSRVLLLCFSYDRKSSRYALSITRIGGAMIVLAALGFFLYLVLGRRKRPPVAET
jgi:protein SCO1/2